MNAQTAAILFVIIVAIAVVASRFLPRQSSADLAITASVNLAVAREFPMGKVQVDVKTFDGVVMLAGYVREFEHKKRIEEIARSTPGVTNVDNRITVRSGD